VPTWQWSVRRRRRRALCTVLAFFYGGRATGEVPRSGTGPQPWRLPELTHTECVGRDRRLTRLKKNRTRAPASDVAVSLHACRSLGYHFRMQACRHQRLVLVGVMLKRRCRHNETPRGPIGRWGGRPRESTNASANLRQGWSELASAHDGTHQAWARAMYSTGAPE